MRALKTNEHVMITGLEGSNASYNELIGIVLYRLHDKDTYALHIVDYRRGAPVPFFNYRFHIPRKNLVPVERVWLETP